MVVTLSATTHTGSGMSHEWTGFAMRTALRTAVAARPGITNLTPEVRVVSYMPSPEEQMPDAIVIGYLIRDADEMERVALGANRYDEVVSLLSRVQVTRPGAGQETADLASTRAQALLAEVETVVRSALPDVGDFSWAGKTVDREAVVIATIRENTGAMLAAIDFEVLFKARVGGS